MSPDLSHQECHEESVMRCMPVIPVLGGLRQEDYDGVGGQSGIHNEMLSEVNQLGWERSSVGGMFTQHARMHAALGFILSTT